MMDELKKTQAEWKKDIQKIQCNLCECTGENHPVYWSCPLFDGEEICQRCCQVECLRRDIDQKFSYALGRSITLEEINQVCQQCNKNYALQNESLADQIEAKFL